MNYFAVPGSGEHVQAFRHHVQRLFLRALRRRSQADRTSWDRVDYLVNLYWPKVAVLHPWPAQRLRVTTQGRSRMH